MEIEIEEVKLEDEELQIIKIKSDGWEKVGDPVSFQMKKTRDEIRVWAKTYAGKFNAEKLLETEVPSETPGQENSLRYHAFKRPGATPAAPAAQPVMAAPVSIDQPPSPPPAAPIPTPVPTPAAPVPQPAAPVPPQPAPAEPVQPPTPPPPLQPPLPPPQPPPPQAAEPRAFGCPYCGKAFAAIPINEVQLVACPSCGGGNIIPPLEQLNVPAVGPQTYQKAPTPAETQQLSVPPQTQYQQPVGQTQAGSQQDPLFNQYNTSDDAISDLISKLADVLVRDDCPLTFKDTGEFMYPKVTICREAYNHMGTRIMDLILIKDGVHDFKVIGNEVHGQAGGTITPMRDELFTIKTLGHASSMPLNDFKVLEDEQKYQIAKALFLFVNEAQSQI